jgi:general L-amino acid transport system substrate-binding protein
MATPDTGYEGEEDGNPAEMTCQLWRVVRALRPAVLALVVAALTLLEKDSGAAGQGRMLRIRQRGALVCGVAPGVAGFARLDEQGRYSGLDVDVCRAVSAAIFGTSGKVRYEPAASVDQFQRTPEVDLVSRRLTWSLQREGMGLLFGPVTFYDGQGFLVPARLSTQQVRQLSNAPVCVVAGGMSESNLTVYFRSHNLTLKKRLIQSSQVEAELSAGRCDAFTADVSELGSLRSLMRKPGDFRILPEQISREPLAQLVRDADVDLFNVLRWTIFAMINAEELGVTSANVAEMSKSGNPDVRRLLGVTPGNGKALGLDEAWAYNVIKTVGNYGEVYERNVGMGSPIKLPRGVNALSSAGGLMFAPPLR